MGTRQKPKIIRPTSCQILLVRINRRAGGAGGWGLQDSLAARLAAESSLPFRVPPGSTTPAAKATDAAGSFPPPARPSAGPLLRAERLPGVLTSRPPERPTPAFHSPTGPPGGPPLPKRTPVPSPALPSLCAADPPVSGSSRGIFLFPRTPKWLSTAPRGSGLYLEFNIVFLVCFFCCFVFLQWVHFNCL